MRAILFLIGGLGAGWLAAAWWTPGPEPLSAPEPRAATGPAGAEGRIAALESALVSEREQRLELEADLATLEVAVARLERSAPAAPGGNDGGVADTRGAGLSDPDNDDDERAPDFRAWRDMDPDERRVQRLVDAGFPPDRADWITRRESELRMNALEAEYEARRTGERPDQVDAEQTLRAELGDADFERYLEARGRPTSVGVRDVIAGSPAEQAGLRRGDRILSYGGRRVYDTGDLNEITIDGVPGESVTVEVVRDGQRIQLVLPRGPLGITGGGRFGRGR